MTYKQTADSADITDGTITSVDIASNAGITGSQLSSTAGITTGQLAALSPDPTGTYNSSIVVNNKGQVTGGSAAGTSDAFMALQYPTNSALMTMPRTLTTSNVSAMTSGVIYLVKCIAYATKTISSISFMCTNVGSGVTSARCGIWDNTGTSGAPGNLLGNTNEISLSTSAISTNTLTANSPNTLSITSGSTYYLGIGFVFSTTSPQIRGYIGLSTAVLSVAPILVYSATNYSSSNMGSSFATGSGYMPFLYAS